MALSPSSSRDVSASAAGYLLDYAERTTDLSVTAIAEATPDLVVAVPARAYDGATAVWVEFFAAGVQVGTGASANIVLNLWDDATDLGRFGQFQLSTLLAPVLLRRKITPTAATHTYKVQAWRTVANGSIEAASPHLPCYLAVLNA